MMCQSEVCHVFKGWKLIAHINFFTLSKWPLILLAKKPALRRHTPSVPAPEIICQSALMTPWKDSCLQDGNISKPFAEFLRPSNFSPVIIIRRIKPTPSALSPFAICSSGFPGFRSIYFIFSASSSSPWEFLEKAKQSPEHGRREWWFPFGLLQPSSFWSSGEVLHRLGSLQQIKRECH